MTKNLIEHWKCCATKQSKAKGGHGEQCQRHRLQRRRTVSALTYIKQMTKTLNNAQTVVANNSHTHIHIYTHKYAICKAGSAYIFNFIYLIYLIQSLQVCVCAEFLMHEFLLFALKILEAQIHILKQGNKRCICVRAKSIAGVL